MTLLALPNPGPSPGVPADAFCSANSWPRVTPRMPDPPTRNRSRRVTPSQVSLDAAPGMTSMAGLREAWEGGVESAGSRPAGTVGAGGVVKLTRPAGGRHG